MLTTCLNSVIEWRCTIPSEFPWCFQTIWNRSKSQGMWFFRHYSSWLGGQTNVAMGRDISNPCERTHFDWCEIIDTHHQPFLIFSCKQAFHTRLILTQFTCSDPHPSFTKRSAPFNDTSFRCLGIQQYLYFSGWDRANLLVVLSFGRDIAVQVVDSSRCCCGQ